MPRKAPAADGSHARVLRVVRRIPAGRVATYGQIATLAELPRQPRLVGYVLAALDGDSPVPWHRVINAAGAISARREGPGGAVLQRLRLEREGVGFDARGRVDLERYRWVPNARRAAPAPSTRDSAAPTSPRDRARSASPSTAPRRRAP